MEGIIESSRTTAYQIKIKLQGGREVALWKRRFTVPPNARFTTTQQALLDVDPVIPVLAPGVSVVLARDCSTPQSPAHRAGIFCILSLQAPDTASGDAKRMKAYMTAISTWLSVASRGILNKSQRWLVPSLVRREMTGCEDAEDEYEEEDTYGECAHVVREAVSLIRATLTRLNVRATLERDLDGISDRVTVTPTQFDNLTSAIECYERFRTDPFAVTVVPLAILDTFAKAYGITARRRARAAVVFKLRTCLSDGGHACCSRQALMASPLLHWNADDVETAITEAAQTGALVLYPTANGQCDVYLPHVYRMETGVAERISLLLRVNRDGAWRETLRSDAVRAALSKHTGGLDGVQCDALVRALTGREDVFVVSGFPGTGKSRLCQAMRDVCTSVGLKVLSCAPTAKAASRLGGGATTVHRALGATPSNVAACSKRVLDADLILLDEVSMLDMNVAHALLQACDPARTRLVFVGDAHQLPSVEWGDFLDSLLACPAVPRVYLQAIYRQADGCSAIWALARSIVDGGPLLRTDLCNASVTWTCDDSLDRVSADILKLRTVHGENMQIISPSKRHGLHTGILNALMMGRPDVSRFLKGDRVVVTKNQQTGSLMNGDCGKVVGVFGVRVALIMDDNRTGCVPESDLDHAYALTIHKAQGSEYDVVVLVLSQQQGRALNRQALYTAVSRAVQRLYVFASRETLTSCVSNMGISRRGHLRDRLLSQNAT